MWGLVFGLGHNALPRRLALNTFCIFLNLTILFWFSLAGMFEWVKLRIRLKLEEGRTYGVRSRSYDFWCFRHQDDGLSRLLDCKCWLFLFIYFTVYQNVLNLHLLKTSLTCNSTSQSWRGKHGSVLLYSFLYFWWSVLEHSISLCLFWSCCGTAQFHWNQWR